MKTTGQKLKELRQQQGYTLDGLAAIGNISKSHLWSIEKDRTKPSYSSMIGVAFVLGVPTEYFFTSADAPTESDIDKVLYAKYLALTDDKKKIVMAVIEVL